MSTPTTEAGKALLATINEAGWIETGPGMNKAILAIEREAIAAHLASDEAVERLRIALVDHDHIGSPFLSLRCDHLSPWVHSGCATAILAALRAQEVALANANPDGNRLNRT